MAKHKETSFDAFLSSAPLLPELIEHIDVGTKWYLLGILLHVDDKRLDGFYQLQGHDDTSKTLKMFQHWLTTTPIASRSQVLEALRKRGIDEHTVADKYEKYLKDLHDTTYKPPSTEAVSILQRNIQSLNEALVSPVPVSQLLYCKRCISEDTLDEMERIDQRRFLDDKKTTLLTAMQETVSNDYRKLKDIATVLSDIKETKDIAKEMMTKYEEKIPEEGVCTVQPQEAVGSNEDRASDILRNNYSALSQSIIEPVRVAKLLHKEVISDEALSSCVTSTRVSDSRAVLLKAVRDAVHSNYKHLELFVTVLRKFSGTVHIGDTIFEEYKTLFPEGKTISELHCHHKILDQSSSEKEIFSASSSSVGGPIYFPLNKDPEFTLLRCKFGSAFNAARCAINEKNIDPDQLRIYLSDCFPHNSDFANRNLKTIYDILEIVKRNCNLIDIHCLKAIVVKFDVSEAFDPLEAYIAEVEEFCKVRDELNESLEVVRSPRQLSRETIILVLDQTPLTCTLYDIANIVQKASGAHIADVHISGISDSHSIAITCFVPMSLTGYFITTVLQNLRDFQSNGLKKLLLDNTIIWEVIDDKQESSTENDSKEFLEFSEPKIEERNKIKEDVEKLKKDLETQRIMSAKKGVEIEKLKAIIREKEERLQVVLVSEKKKPALDSVPCQSQILHPLGMKHGRVVRYKGLLFTPEDLKTKLTDPNTMIKVQPALLSFNGLPKSGKTTAVVKLLQNYVEESSLDPISSKNYRPEHVGIAHYELIAVSSLPGEDYILTEAAQESSFAFGVLSVFKSIIKDEKRVPLFDAKAVPQCFNNIELNGHFHHMYSFLQSQESIPKGSKDSSEFGNYNSYLSFLPESIALVNIWDMASSNTVHHLLSALEGYLFRSHLWLFIDLDDDLEKLDENFEIPKTGCDGAILLKQRPHLHYLLRSCWSTRDNEKKRRGVCTMFAKHITTGPGEVRDKVNALRGKVQPVAHHIGVSELLEDRIESINLEIDHKRLHEMFQRILKYETTFDAIPLSWLFLRSLFYRFEKIFVSKDDLMEMAKECGMDEGSVKDFCKFFTSFGSIIDFSLVNSSCQHIIVKPFAFLQSLDSFFAQKNGTYQHYPSMAYGIVPKKACQDSFKEEWLVFMDALECLNLATRVNTCYLEMPPDVPIERKGKYYYIPLCCTGPLIDEPDPYSVHLLTSISSPHFFKQVSFAKQLLDTLPQPVLVPCKNVNQTIIKNLSTDTTITISSHVPAIKLKVDEPNEEICALIIQATEKIAEESRIPVRYKFVQFCTKTSITKVESLPSALYHCLPEAYCKNCQKNPKLEELLKAWTEALRRSEMPSKFKATGEVGLAELSKIVERIKAISPAPNDVHKIALVFKVDHFESLDENDPIGKILLKWNEEKRNGSDFEPRRALAQKIYPELGEAMAEKDPDEKAKAATRQKYKKLAKEIDIYYCP